MTSPHARRAVELLVEEAASARVAGRYGAAVEAAGRAVTGADDDATGTVRYSTECRSRQERLDVL